MFTRDAIRFRFTAITYKYDNNGALATVTDSATGRLDTYCYDFLDRLVFYSEWDSRYYHTTVKTWDSKNNLTVWSEKINGIDNTFYYRYNEKNLVDRFAYDHGSKLYEYDELDRMGLAKTFHDSRELKRDEYTYNGPTGQVSKHTVTIGTAQEYNYTYDDRGNILSVSDGTNKTSYVYDSANQLLRENNQAAGKTWVYTYDAAGNILTKKEYAYTEGTLGTAQDTINYTYGNSSWGDLLTAWDGQTITYDKIGNPTQFGSRTFTWTHGRQLASLTENGTEWKYTYDANGLRSGKSSGATSYYYLYKGGKLTYQEGEGRQLYFSYDITGAPYAMWYAGVNYYYVTNLQGDVTGILDKDGNRIVTYTYDAWGNILSITGSHASTIGQYNPLRYRGYVYDSETQLYYLQSRYYDPSIGRFLNADALASTGQGLLGNNMFAYCNNNPVMGIDPTGYWNWGGFWAGVATVVVGVAIIAATVASAGAAAPLAAAAISAVGTAIGTAVTATGAVTTYAAATEMPMVIDIAVTNGATHDKHGYSVVIDFDSDSSSFDTYYHYGKTTAGYSCTYGIGLVDGYDGPGDYGGHFVDGGVTYSYNGIDYGIDVCTDPSEPFAKCSAAMFTVGASFPSTTSSKVGKYWGVDYYAPISYF